MSENPCPYCGELKHFIAVGRTHRPKGWAWWCGKCGAQGPVRATEAEALESLPRPSLAQAMLPRALEAMEAVLAQGREDHPPGDWIELGAVGNAGRARAHDFKMLMGDKSEDHLAHGAQRLLMALELREGA